jgi:outer membrane protein assembly factor BamB
MVTTIKRLAFALGAMGLVVGAHARAAAIENWPQFRGAEARGIAEGKGLPDKWSTTENVAWKTDLPGRGWSCPIVWGKRVFVTTVINTGATEAAKKGLYMGGEAKKMPDTPHQWKLMCLDLDSGKVLWDKTAYEGIPAQPIHIKNSYASETPVTDGERVYAYFGNVGLWCYDLDGKEVWSKKLDPHKTRFGWGTASSPVVHKDRVYIVNDNDEDSYLLALDKKTGNEIWRVKREEKSNWSTPYIWVNEQRTEIITPGSMAVRSYDLDGKLLWSFKGMSMITIATPYEADGLLYISSGYVMDKRRPLYAIKPGASGDITLPKDDKGQGPTSNEFIVWSQPQGGPYNPSTMVYEGKLYVLYDRGGFACFNAKDGSIVYDRTQIPDAKDFTVSPWAYNGKIFCMNEDGITYVLRAGDKFEPLHQNKLAEDDMGMATPAIVGDKLLIRTAARIYCIKNGAKS